MVRREDDLLLRGAGRFVTDIAASCGLSVAFLRSPRAGMAIAGIEVEAARAAPGVRGVFTAGDLGPLGAAGVNPLVPGLCARSFSVLAEARVEAVGQPVAAVVASTRHQAEDAAELMALTLRPDAPTPPAGYAQSWRHGELMASPASAIRVRHARLAPSPLEPRAAAAAWRGGRLVVHLQTQSPHRARADLARILGIAETALQVIAPDVGGAFGARASICPEDAFVAWAAWHLRSAIAWRATRAEEMLAGPHGRGITTEGALAVDVTGRMTALLARIAAPLGHWMPFSAVVPGRNAGRILPGPYLVPAIDIAISGRTDATAPVGIYRGAGRPEAAMLMERLVDQAARARGEDPVAFRRRNLIPPDALPRETPTGTVLDSGDYPALLDRAAALFDYEGERRRQEARRRAGEIIGLGVAMYLEPCGEGWESASLTLLPDGSFVAATGSSAQGQGRETAFAQLLADALGVHPDQVAIRHGDTDVAPPGIGALASRSTGIGGSALLRAAAALRARAAPIVARFGLDLTAAAWRDVARACNETLTVTERFTATGEAWSSGCCMARLAIDRETGTPTIEQLVLVDDAGRIVNPMLLEGQLLGGIAQGIGEALKERLVYNRDGELLTGSLMDYALPIAADMPPVTLASLPTISPVNLVGARGVGEAGCIGVPAAIVNAAMDALAPFGVTHLDPPLTAETLWRGLHGMPPREDPAS